MRCMLFEHVMDNMWPNSLIEVLGLFSVPLPSSSVFAPLFSRAVGEQRGGGEQSQQPAMLLNGAEVKLKHTAGI